MGNVSRVPRVRGSPLGGQYWSASRGVVGFVSIECYGMNDNASRQAGPGINIRELEYGTHRWQTDSSTLADNRGPRSFTTFGANYF